MLVTTETHLSLISRGGFAVLHWLAHEITDGDTISADVLARINTNWLAEKNQPNRSEKTRMRCVELLVKINPQNDVVDVTCKKT